jgi:hypothetical protein
LRKRLSSQPGSRAARGLYAREGNVVVRERAREEPFFLGTGRTFRVHPFEPRDRLEPFLVTRDSGRRLAFECESRRIVAWIRAFASRHHARQSHADNHDKACSQNPENRWALVHDDPRIL